MENLLLAAPGRLLLLVMATLASACDSGLVTTSTPTPIPTSTVVPTPTRTATAPATPTLTVVPTPVSYTPTQLAKMLGPSVVRIVAKLTGTAQHPTGSTISATGFVFDDKAGHIVTAEHVIAGAYSIEVYVGRDRHPRAARVLARDPAADLAVLVVEETSGLHAAELSTSDTPLGASVVALGFPESPDEAEMTVTTGVLSKKGVDWGKYKNLLQHTAGLTFGNSGGPLVDQRGVVIGINVLYYNAGGAASFYAVEIAYARPIIQQILGGVNRNYIGVTLLPNTWADHYGTDKGMVIDRVSIGSPAEKQGILAGDLLISLGGVPVDEEAALYEILSTYPTEELAIKVVRVDATSVRFVCEGSLVPGDPTRGRELTCQRMDPPSAPPPPCEETENFELRLCDAFDTPPLNWWLGRQDYFEAALQKGRYALSIWGQRSYLLSVPADGIVFPSGAINTNVYLSGDGVAGLLGRWVSSSDYYECWIDNGSRFGCFAMEAGTHRPLTQQATSPAIRPNNFNDLTLAIIGDELLFRINGESVAKVSDISPRSGQWGFFVATGQGEDRLSAFYEDVRIWKYTQR